MKILKIAAVFAVGLWGSAVLANPDQWQREWPDTDFTKTSIQAWTEIMSGGPPKDGIPALSDPKFRKASQEDRIDGSEPVITVEINGDVRAYPVRYLTWHEIANDTVGGVPVAAVADDITFAFQAGAGFYKPLNEFIDAGLGYRYVFSNDQNFGPLSTEMGIHHLELTFRFY
mgnify:CR=1 FL=1